MVEYDPKEVPKIYYPPETKTSYSMRPTVFLAGTIDMGNSVNWQDVLSERLLNESKVGRVFNPRRKEWDSSWEQSIENPMFNEQVNWELDHLDFADIKFFYFAPDSLSPITLAELGMTLAKLNDEWSRKKKEVVICCPDGFWRQGNVEIMAHRECLKIFRDYEEAVQNLIEKIGRA